jgi:protoporphyrinogen oxidase
MLHIIRNRENVEENYVPYPVQHSVQYLPFRVQQKCLEDLDKFDEKKNVTNFDEFSQKYFGKTLQDIFIRPYNEKVRSCKICPRGQMARTLEMIIIDSYRRCF